MDTQLIAHDKEVYDIAWGGVGVFASVSADGSVRVFDLRQESHLKFNILRWLLPGNLQACQQCPELPLSG